MNRNNSMTTGDFIGEHIFWAIISWVWYKNLLFRCMDDHSLAESRWIFLVIIVVSCVVGILMELEYSRNGMSVFCNLMLGFGSYTVLTYLPIRRTLIIVTMSVVTILSFVFISIVMFRKIKNKRKAGKIVRWRMHKSLMISNRLFAMGLALVISVTGMGTFFGSGIMNASEKPATKESINEQTIANNIETVLLLQDELWETLTVQQRLNVLQTIANIEQRYLGLPNELNVGATNLREGVLAYYTDNTHEIIISIDSLLNNSSWELLDSVCHEAYHSYQHRLVDAYCGSDEEIKSLRIFRKANSYADEFSDYISGDEDFCSYYFQNCESDARDYAEEAVYDYYQRINEYLDKNEGKMY